ncbi:MAG TPA: mycofactocin system FadH/OYE family oxidoreductase 2 [Desulfomonilaceae bacterium]|nr:mycofactocin system FadH/OYE family oxidoreductase 2 [Desulfomonilaceae bacterium]
MPEFKFLFSPLRMGSAVVANRISFSAHLTNFGENNKISERHVSYYRERARGGAGLIITEELSVHASDHPYEELVFAFAPDVVPGFKQLTQTIHRYETKIFAQLNHNGTQGDGSFTRQAVWGPSQTFDPIFREWSKEMEPEEIEDCINSFARAAEHCREGGFDGIEIQIGHSSLIRQFLSPLTNRREDEYGGDLDGRLRFCREVLEAVKRATGTDFTLGVRLNADEMHPRGGLTLKDAAEIAKRLEATGVIDFVDLSIATFYNLYLVEGSMHIPLAYTVPLASTIKRSVTLPVFATNRINDPHLAERILADGHADMIGMVRALICDPELPNKAREGRASDIRHCVADNQGCIGRMGLGHGLSCIQNPAVGRERELGSGTLAPADCAKKVVVVGAGPAGLEAARVLALRGHSVILFEKGVKPGGQNLIASKAAGRSEIEGVSRWLIGQVTKLGNIDMRLQTEATESMVLDQHPDAVVVATGSMPPEKPFPGEYGLPGAVNLWQVLNEEVQLGERVVIVDMDGHHGCNATAEFLADKGKKVHILTPALSIGGILGPLQDFHLSRRRLALKNVTFTSDVAVLEIQGTVIKCVQVYSGELVEFIDHDNIVLAVRNQSLDRLYFSLRGKVKELYRIGDCVAPRKLDSAILEGQMIGRTI